MSNKQNQKVRKLEKVDTYIIYLCLLFLLGSVGVLSKNYIFQGSNSGDNTQIGFVSKMKNNVRRKFDSGMIWHDTREKEILFENDWVYTGENSVVTIAFDDGGELTLDPNSLVVLTRNRGKMKLELQHGSFIADLKEGSEVTVAKSGKTEVITTKNQKVAVSEKNIQVSPAPIAKKEKPEVEDEFEGLTITVEDSSIQLKQPKNDSLILVQSTVADVSFEWTATEGFNNFHLEASPSEDFKKPISQNFEDNFAKMIIPYKGDVYWRVSAKAKDGIVKSEVFHFSIKQNTAPLAKLPEDGQTISKRIEKDQEPSLDFEWIDKEHIWTQYEVEISKSQSFPEGETIAHDSLLGQINRIPLPEKGVYYWRVRGKDENHEQKSNWSKPRKFTFNLEFPQERAAPKLNKKNISYYLDSNDIEFINKDKTIDLSHKKEKIHISWEMKTPAPSYKVQFSHNDQFKSILAEKETNKNSVSFSKSKVGKIYYRVAPQYSNGDKAAPSYGTVRTFLPNLKVLRSKAKGKSFNLAWSDLPIVDEYEVVYYDHPSEQDKQTLYFKENEVKIKNSNGFLSWKVRGVNKSRTPLTKFTSIQKITGKVLASVPKEEPGKDYPLIVSPAKKKTFLSFDNNPTFVLMRWKYKEKHTSFDLEISTTPNMDFVILSRNVRKKKTVIRKAFKPGKYYFRVRSINGEEKGKWTPIQVFRVIQGKAE